MPTNRKRRRIRRRERDELTHDLAHELADGRKFRWWLPTDPSVYAAAWVAVCETILSWFRRHRAGTRPHGWWVCVGTQEHADMLAEIVPDRSQWPTPHQGRRCRERSPFLHAGETEFLRKIGELSEEEIARAKAYDPARVTPLIDLLEQLGVAPQSRKR